MLLALLLSGVASVAPASAVTLDAGVAACRADASACSRQREALRAELIATASRASAEQGLQIFAGPAVVAEAKARRQQRAKACRDSDDAACVAEALDPREPAVAGLRASCARKHALSCSVFAALTLGDGKATKAASQAATALLPALCDHGIGEACVLSPSPSAPLHVRLATACARGLGAGCAVGASQKAIVEGDVDGAAAALTHACTLDPGLLNCPGEKAVEDDDRWIALWAPALVRAANGGNGDARLLLGELSLPMFSAGPAVLDVDKACGGDDDLLCVAAARSAFNGNEVPPRVVEQRNDKYSIDGRKKREQSLKVKQKLCTRGVHQACRELAVDAGPESERAFEREDCLRNRAASCARTFDGQAASLPLLERGCSLGNDDSCRFAVITAPSERMREKIYEVGCAAGVAVQCANRDRGRRIADVRAGKAGALLALVERCEDGDDVSCTAALSAADVGVDELLVARLLQRSVGACLERRIDCAAVQKHLVDQRFSVGFYRYLMMQSLADQSPRSRFRRTMTTAAELRLRVRKIGVLLPPDAGADATDHAEIAEVLRTRAVLHELVVSCIAGVEKERCGFVDDACADWEFADRAVCAAGFAKDGDGHSAPLGVRRLREAADKEQALACANDSYVAADRFRSDPRCPRP